MSKTKLLKLAYDIEADEIHAMGTSNGQEFHHVYEFNKAKTAGNGAVWHKRTDKIGDFLIGMIYIGDKLYRFKLVPRAKKNTPSDADWLVMTNEKGVKSEFVPESWVSQYYTFLHGKIKLDGEVYEIILKPNNFLTLMNDYAAARGKFGGSPDKRPCFTVYVRNDNIKRRKNYTKEV